MAVGDIVSQIGNADFSYQPAAGVQVMVTACFLGEDDIRSIGLRNAAFNVANAGISATGTWGGSGTDALSTKIMIDNTLYIRVYRNAASYGGFTGIQIK